MWLYLQFKFAKCLYKCFQLVDWIPYLPLAHAKCYGGNAFPPMPCFESHHPKTQYAQYCDSLRHTANNQCYCQTPKDCPQHLLGQLSQSATTSSISSTQLAQKSPVRRATTGPERELDVPSLVFTSLSIIPACQSLSLSSSPTLCRQVADAEGVGLGNLRSGTTCWCPSVAQNSFISWWA